MSWFLAFPSCIDYTVEFKTYEEGLEYLKAHPRSNLSLQNLETGLVEADGGSDEDGEIPDTV